MFIRHESLVDEHEFRGVKGFEVNPSRSRDRDVRISTAADPIEIRRNRVGRGLNVKKGVFGLLSGTAGGH